ncbi:MAG: hypothetical protein GXO77_01475 [Calditrichaeota bacterium]|nr:hypothetical protein [Calditrichota bacterium]
MPKRLTSIRLTEMTDRQIRDFTKLGYTLAEIVSLAIDRFHRAEIRKERDTAIYAPIYNQIYRQSDKSEKGAIPVKNNDSESYLSPIEFKKVVPNITNYLECKHALNYPYGSVDFEEQLTDPALKQIIAKPRQFCKASIVATPLISLL